MIKIKDTKNMIGITIHGDFEDLKTLHRALSDYLRFYFEHQEESGAYSCYETILGLCYDIRHAYQGDRNVEAVENNHKNIAQLASCFYQMAEDSIENERDKYKHGNLYFNVEVLYPWAIYYLFTLQAIAEDIYRHEWFKNDKYGYTEYQAEQDLALIQYFVHLLWKRLREHLPEDVMAALWDYTRICNHIEYYFDFSDMYIEWLCTYWVNAFRTNEQRHDALPLICLELSSILDEFEEELVPIIEEAKAQEKNAPGKTEGNNNTRHSIDNPSSDHTEQDIRILKIQASIAQNTLNTLKYYDEYYSKYSPVDSERQLSYLDQIEFSEIIFEHVQEHGPFTEESYEQWLDQQLGKVNWYDLEW